jgi:hypothetical protein
MDGDCFKNIILNFGIEEDYKMDNRIYAFGYMCFLASRKYIHLDTKEGQDLFIKNYQNDARIYLDEYQSNESEFETYNFFYSRFLKRK